MKRVKGYQDFLIQEKFDDNLKAELKRMGITDEDDINKYLWYAHRGNLSNYLRQEGKDFKFGMLLAMFKDAQEAKKKTDFKVGFFKSLHRILPMALAPFFPIAAVFGIIFGSTRAFNKIIGPILNDPTDNYESFLEALIKRGMQVAEGEIPVKDRFTRAFVVSDNLVAAIRPDVLQKFASELSKKMSEENPDKVVPHDYIENELKRYLNKEFDVNPPILTKDQLIEGK
jgi:hypothetical protein